MNAPRRTRPYAVTNKVTGEDRLVEAVSRAQAYAHVAQSMFTCRVVSGIEAAKMAGNVTLETAIKSDDAAI